MDSFVYIREQVRQKLLKANLCSKHVKDASSFILTLGEHAENIGKLWLELFQASEDPASQLALLYVANEILIKCSKYGVPEFKDVFRPFVTEAVKHLRPGHLVPKLSKLFNYWLRYRLFETHFVQQLLDGLAQTGLPGKKRVAADPFEVSDDLVKDFHPENLTDSLRKLKQTEEELQDQSKPDLQHLYVNLPIPNIVSSLKSKEESRVLSRRVELCCKNLDSYIKRRTEYLEQLISITRLVEMAEHFYETQHKEVAIVVNAYSAYGKRVSKTLEKAEGCVGITSPKASIGDGKAAQYEVNSSPKPTATPQSKLESDDEKFDNFGDDFANDDDSDFESAPTVSANNPYVNNVVYHPSPIQPLKETEPRTSPDKVMTKTEPIVTDSGPEKPVSTVASADTPPTVPDMGAPFALHPIQNASGDVDYRPLLDPTFQSRFQGSAKNSITTNSEPSGTVKITSPATTTLKDSKNPAEPASHHLSTSVCLDDDGDSMEMSDDDEPAELKEDADQNRKPTELVLEAGPLDPSAVDTGDRDWRLLTKPLAKSESTPPCKPVLDHPAIPSVPIRADPWRSRFPQPPAYLPGPIPKPPNPFTLTPAISIPPPPPPPKFIRLSHTDQSSQAPRFSSPSISEPRIPPPPPPPPPPVTMSNLSTVHFAPGPRLPGGITPSFPKLHSELSLPFPRPTTANHPSPINREPLSVVQGEQSPALPVSSESRYSPVSMFGPSDSDDRLLPATIEPSSATTPQEEAGINLKSVVESNSISSAVTGLNEPPSTQNQMDIEDPFAVISRLTGLSNLVKSLSAKSDTSSTTSSTVGQAVPHYSPSFTTDSTPKVQQPLATEPTDCDMRQTPQTEPVTVQRLLETFVFRRTAEQPSSSSNSNEELQSKGAGATLTNHLVAAPITASVDQTPVLSPESNSPDDVEVIESFTQSANENEGSSPSGGETPTQDEHGENHTDAPLSVSLASLLLPKPSTGSVTGTPLFAMPEHLSSISSPVAQPTSGSVGIPVSSHDAVKVTSVNPSNSPMTLPNNMFGPPSSWSRLPMVGTPSLGSLPFAQISTSSVSPQRAPIPTVSSTFSPVVSGTAQQIYLLQSSQQQQINSIAAGLAHGAPSLWHRFTPPLLPPTTFASFLPTAQQPPQPPSLLNLQLFNRPRPPNS
ncbi:hypothetical protein CRM22_003612 [Opisthorchis felineus]|uniref:CID domain-containing protein n=1 Tax=Opisthorchis felineus TaxID=147828 RepID=A0A4S2M0D0_OPIFE|nr:hypothetical protein CRM22_003612 [Opisthorchis felineus]